MIAFVRENRHILRKILQSLLIGIIFYYIFVNLYEDWNELSSYRWNVDWKWAGGAFLLLLNCSFLFAIGWNLILRQLGGILSLKEAFKVTFLSNMGRYIPGKLWSITGNIYLCSKSGIPMKISSASLFLVTLVQIISAFLIFYISLIFSSKLYHTHEILMYFPLIPLGLLLAYPPIINTVIGWGARVIKKNFTPVDLKFTFLLLILIYWCLLWAISGLAFYFLVISIFPLSPANIPGIIGIFSFAWAVGFLAFFAPAGFGVYEASMIILLSFYMPTAMATIIALSARILRTVTEVSCALLAWKI